MQDYALSPQANQRKGGLLCLAAAAVGLGDAGSAHLQTIVPPVLDSFTDQDSRVRYYACEVSSAVLLCVGPCRRWSCYNSRRRCCQARCSLDQPMCL